MHTTGHMRPLAPGPQRVLKQGSISVMSYVNVLTKSDNQRL